MVEGIRLWQTLSLESSSAKRRGWWCCLLTWKNKQCWVYHNKRKHKEFWKKVTDWERERERERENRVEGYWGNLSAVIRRARSRKKIFSVNFKTFWLGGEMFSPIRVLKIECSVFFLLNYYIGLGPGWKNRFLRVCERLNVSSWKLRVFTYERLFEWVFVLVGWDIVRMRVYGLEQSTYSILKLPLYGVAKFGKNYDFF